MTNVSATAKRWIAVAGLAFVVLLVVVLGSGAGGDGGGGDYKVRAIFDNAGFLVPGEDVKVAGVKVGTIESLDVTANKKAAIVLRIEDPAFQDFRRDASCRVRLQSLIGEKFVACEPTQPKAQGAPQTPPLHQIQHGDGEGEYLLPVTNTSSPVDVDLLNNIMRAPQRQRFAIILNELGVGLAGNGDELRRVVRRANPALQEFDKVLAILASQNRVLADLARDSDQALAATARESDSLSDFIRSSGVTAAATAERGDDLEANFERLPEFLRQLRPTAQRLGEFAAAGLPVMADLRAAAPSVNKIFKQLGPFSTAALPTFRTLGNFADVSRVALQRSQPVIEDLDQLGRKSKPLASSLAKGLTDLQGQHGIENLLNVILFTVGSGNGFDDIGHYLRSYIYVGQCLEYVTRQQRNTCDATFINNDRAPGASAAQAPASELSAPLPQGAADTGLSVTDPASSGESIGTAEPTQSVPSGSSGETPQSGLLGYLLGNGSTR